MSRYWLGCSGWAYDDWVGPFYKPGTPPGEYLSSYARVFRTVEVDSSFYRPPTPFLVQRWVSRTPDEFRFALKLPRDVTHKPASDGGVGALRSFAAVIDPIRTAGKLAAIVFQFPPSFRKTSGERRLDFLLSAVPDGLPVAVELRHSSWWTEATRKRLEKAKAALVWSVVPETEPPPWVTGPFLYARFVGDRALDRFDRIQREGTEDLRAMKQRFEDEGRGAETVFAYSNNHFMGFAPGTVRELAGMLREPVPELERASRSSGQRSLDQSVPPPGDD